MFAILKRPKGSTGLIGSDTAIIATNDDGADYTLGLAKRSAQHHPNSELVVLEIKTLHKVEYQPPLVTPM